MVSIPCQSLMPGTEKHYHRKAAGTRAAELELSIPFRPTSQCAPWRSVRPAERYSNNFENIRKLQRYIKSQALSHGVPIVPNHSFDQAISAVLDLVMEKATGWAAMHSSEAHPPRGRTA